MQLASSAPLYLPNGQAIHLVEKQQGIFLLLDSETQLQAQRDTNAALPQLKLVEHQADLYQCLWLLSYYFISHKQTIPSFDLNAINHKQINHCLQKGLLSKGKTPGIFFSETSRFWQQSSFWTDCSGSDYPLSMTTTNGVNHPLRQPVPDGEVYRRYIPELNCYFSLVTADEQQHLNYLHQWMNNPRVDYFWQESGDLQKHRDYLQTQISDPHTHVLFGCFDHEPFAYFEAYWAKEDRIGPFYQCDNYDRGIHMLVGDDTHRGPHKVMTWLPSLAHFLFLQDARTQRIVSEPRADNQKMIHYLQQTGFYKQKEFNFPHKRAALMHLERQTFFELCPFSPGVKDQ